jgi:hypothetical protein
MTCRRAIADDARLVLVERYLAEDLCEAMGHHIIEAQVVRR